MTRDEQRAYQRGYNRQLARTRERVERVLRVARGYRERLTDIDRTRRCDNCVRWTRGCPTCVWGKCAAGFERFTEPSMWADSFTGEKQQRAIITTEDFACVNWLPK
jgi:hypothetical protein